MFRMAGVATVSLFLLAGGVVAQEPAPVWDSIGWILGTSGTTNDGGHRYELPRTDLRVRVGDVDVTSALALGSWVAFGGGEAAATVVGDIVVTSAELGAVLAELSAQRLEVSAVHNHLVGEQPRITYVHISGEGAALDLASRLDAALSRTATPRAGALMANAPAIDSARVFAALGRSGRAGGSVAQLSFDLPTSPSTDRWGGTINIQMVDATRAIATGDFTVSGSRVEPILDALAKNGITVTALQSHLLGDSATQYYIHFWTDSALPRVLTGLRAAIDAASGD
jgi:hypothetical protein